jgi:hypothetical protein
MKCINSWVYKGVMIWQYPMGYVVEGTNGEYHDTLEKAKQTVDNLPA